MKMKKVALIGAGAVGAYLIYGFTNCSGIDFCVVAEGNRAELLKREGIVINDITYHPDILTPEEAHGADLLFVCTKYHGLSGALDMIERTVDDHTTVMSLLNGIDSEEIIGERIGMEHMVYSVMRISSERRNGKIMFSPEKTIGISFGERAVDTERLQAIYDLFQRAQLKAYIVEDIRLNQWKKYSMNIIYNLPQAVLDVGFGAYYDSRYVAQLRDRMYQEVCLVAKAEGITLTGQDDWRGVCVPKARFSTLQDLDAKRETEIETLAGVLIALAKKHGIDVPFCEYTYYAIKALEEKNTGKFDY